MGIPGGCLVGSAESAYSLHVILIAVVLPVINVVFSAHVIVGVQDTQHHLNKSMSVIMQSKDGEESSYPLFVNASLKIVWANVSSLGLEYNECLTNPSMTNTANIRDKT